MIAGTEASSTKRTSTVWIKRHQTAAWHQYS